MENKNDATNSSRELEDFLISLLKSPEENFNHPFPLLLETLGKIKDVTKRPLGIESTAGPKLRIAVVLYLKLIEFSCIQSMILKFIKKEVLVSNRLLLFKAIIKDLTFLAEKEEPITEDEQSCIPAIIETLELCKFNERDLSSYEITILIAKVSNKIIAAEEIV